jgi:hypothetical protein
MTATCVATGAVLSALMPGWTRADIATGMAGPLLAATVTWWLVERTWRTNPGALSNVMMLAFAVKLILFGVYVAIALRVLHVAPVPFITSFTLAFVGLYVAEAVLLHKLFSRARVLS